MLEGERPTFSGKYYRTEEAMAEPRFRDHIPLMIGGSGEKKTIPLAASYFDHLNIIAGFDELPRKVEVGQGALRGDRPRPGDAGDQHARHRADRRERHRRHDPRDFKQQAVFGSPEQVAEQIKTKVLDAGVDGVDPQPRHQPYGIPAGGITAVGGGAEAAARTVEHAIYVANHHAGCGSSADWDGGADYGRRCMRT